MDILQILIYIIQGGAIVSAVLMVFLILLQEPKSGGLTMLGGTGLDRSLGVSNPLRRATVYLAIFFMAGALLLSIYQSSERRTLAASQPEEKPKEAAKPGVTPTTPAAEPQYVVKLTGDVPPQTTQLSEAVKTITGEKDPMKLVQLIAGKTIITAPKAKAEAYVKQLEATGAHAEMALVTTPPAPLTQPKNAEPVFKVMLTDNGTDLAALKKAVSEITGEKDDAKLMDRINSKLIILDKLAKADEARLKLIAAGAKVDMVKLEIVTPPVTPPTTPAVPAPSTPAVPAPAPATTPAPTGAAPVAPATPPAAPAPAPAPAQP